MASVLFCAMAARKGSLRARHTCFPCCYGFGEAVEARDREGRRAHSPAGAGETQPSGGAQPVSAAEAGTAPPPAPAAQLLAERGDSARDLSKAADERGQTSRDRAGPPFGPGTAAGDAHNRGGSARGGRVGSPAPAAVAGPGDSPSGAAGPGTYSVGGASSQLGTSRSGPSAAAACMAGGQGETEGAASQALSPTPKHHREAEGAGCSAALRAPSGGPSPPTGSERGRPARSAPCVECLPAEEAERARQADSAARAGCALAGGAAEPNGTHAQRRATGECERPDRAAGAGCAPAAAGAEGEAGAEGARTLQAERGARGRAAGAALEGGPGVQAGPPCPAPEVQAGQAASGVRRHPRFAFAAASQQSGSGGRRLGSWAFRAAGRG